MACLARNGSKVNGVDPDQGGPQRGSQSDHRTGRAQAVGFDYDNPPKPVVAVTDGFSIVTFARFACSRLLSMLPASRLYGILKL